MCGDVTSRESGDVSTKTISRPSIRMLKLIEYYIRKSQSRTTKQGDITGSILLIHVRSQNVVRRRTYFNGPQELKHRREDENSLILRIGYNDASIVVAANA